MRESDVREHDDEVDDKWLRDEDGELVFCQGCGDQMTISDHPADHKWCYLIP